MKMISWQFVEPKKPLQRVECDPPAPGAGEVRIRVAGCGVCHTDLGYYYDGVPMRSPLPMTLGREISGIVEAVGSGAESWMGKAVVIPAVMPCGTCDVCSRDFGNICPTQKMPGNDIQGGFSSHIVVPCRQLCEVPLDADGKPKGAGGIELAELSVVADAVTTPYQAIVESGLGPADTAIFIGVGGVGGFGAQIAKALGATVIAIDVDPAKLNALAPYVDTTFNSKELSFKDLRKAISDFVKSKGKRRTEWKIFETSGTGAGQKTAFGLLVHGAHLAVVGFTLDMVEVRLSNLMAYHATAKGNWGCVPKHYPAVVKLALEGRIQLKPFVKCFPLDQINEVFEMAHQRKILERPIMVP